MWKRFELKIEVYDDKDTYIEVDPKMPFLLADEIKRIVKEFYKDEK